MKAWLCLGSNLNDPLSQLKKAIAFLSEKCYISILQTGKPTATKPYGFTEQPDFINQLLEIETLLRPLELLAFLKKAEIELGRKTSVKWGPRSIDIDILFYDNEIHKTEELIIPHPGITERRYLLELLNDIIPDFVHPEIKKNIREIYLSFIKENKN